MHSTTNIAASSTSKFVCMQRGAQNAVEIAEGDVGGENKREMKEQGNLSSCTKQNRVLTYIQK